MLQLPDRKGFKKMKVNADSRVTPRFLTDDLTNDARGPMAFITLGTNLSGAETRTSLLSSLSWRKLLAIQLFMESKDLFKICSLEVSWGLKEIYN